MAETDFVGAALKELKSEVKKHPYQVLGAAASLGYMFGQGWLKGAVRLGLAYFAQNATSLALSQLGGRSGSPSQPTIH